MASCRVRQICEELVLHVNAERVRATFCTWGLHLLETSNNLHTQFTVLTYLTASVWYRTVPFWASYRHQYGDCLLDSNSKIVNLSGRSACASSCKRGCTALGLIYQLLQGCSPCSKCHETTYDVCHNSMNRQVSGRIVKTTGNKHNPLNCMVYYEKG